MKKEVETLNRLEDLGGTIRAGEPGEILYNLGSGDARTELIMTYIDGKSRISNRIASHPLVRLYQSNGKILMDVTDSDPNSDAYGYRGLRPTGATFEPPEHTPYELGDLVIDLDGGDRQLAISQFLRSE